MTNITRANFGGQPYRELGDLMEELQEVIDRYALTVPTAGVIGILRLLEHATIMRGLEE